MKNLRLGLAIKGGVNQVYLPPLSRRARMYSKTNRGDLVEREFDLTHHLPGFQKANTQKKKN